MLRDEEIISDMGFKTGKVKKRKPLYNSDPDMYSFMGNRHLETLIQLKRIADSLEELNKRR